jgi:hypothetical protein
MVAPPTGTADVVVTMTAATAVETVCGATSWSGVDQMDPIGSIVEAKGTSNLASASVPTSNGEVVRRCAGGFRRCSRHGRRWAVGAMERGRERGRARSGE